MAELLSGTRPARPGRLIVVCGIVFAVTLGLAYSQVSKARQLGPVQRIEGTPLEVRLPKDFQRDAHEPNRFVLRPRPGEEQIPFRRGVRIVYERINPRAYFMPSIPQVKLVHRRNSRIGEYAATELRFIHRIAGQNFTIFREQVLRYAILPDGWMILLDYTSLEQMQPADEEMLEEIASNVRNQKSTPQDAKTLPARAGVAFASDADWQFIPCETSNVAGFYILGSNDGVPAWSIAVFRTWLADGRNAADLLLDFAAEFWMLPENKALILRDRREDGVEITGLRHPEVAERKRIESHTARCVFVVSESPREAVILIAYAGGEKSAADEAMRQISASLQITPIDEIPQIEPARESARALVTKLSRRGAAARWGREASSARFQNDGTDGERVECVINRNAVNRDPNAGYEGRQIRRSETREETEHWTMDGQARTYAYSRGFASPSGAVQSLESRQATDSVSREIRIERRLWSRRAFRPSDAFVPPPCEEIIHGWVARGEPATTAIIDASGTFSRGTHTELVRQLSPKGDSQRVLIQTDYWPVGSVVEFDAQSGEIIGFETLDGRFDRVSASSDRSVPKSRVYKTLHALASDSILRESAIWTPLDRMPHGVVARRNEVETSTRDGCTETIPLGNRNARSAGDSGLANARTAAGG